MVLIRNFHGKWPSARTIWVRFSDKIPAEIRITLIYNMFPISVLGSFGNFHAMWFACWPAARPPALRPLGSFVWSDSLGFTRIPMSCSGVSASATNSFPLSIVLGFFIPGARPSPGAATGFANQAHFSTNIGLMPDFFGCSVFWLQIVFWFSAFIIQLWLSPAAHSNRTTEKACVSGLRDFTGKPSLTKTSFSKNKIDTFGSMYYMY